MTHLTLRWSKNCQSLITNQAIVHTHCTVYMLEVNELIVPWPELLQEGLVHSVSALCTSFNLQRAVAVHRQWQCTGSGNLNDFSQLNLSFEFSAFAQV